MDEDSTDVELLAAVAAGSSDALAALYRRHAAWLTLRLTRRCADSTGVDEVLQDTFVAAWKGAGRFSGEGQVAAWLWGIAIRRLGGAVRRRPPPAPPPRALVDACRRRPAPAQQLDERMCDRQLVESAEDRVLLGIEHGDLAGALD